MFEAGRARLQQAVQQVASHAGAQLKALAENTGAFRLVLGRQPTQSLLGPDLVPTWSLLGPRLGPKEALSQRSAESPP